MRASIALSAPPGCLDGSCPWIESRDGPAPLLAQDSLWFLLIVGVPVVVALTAIVALARGRTGWAGLEPDG